jgi:class 3 adenylate cyclase/predicted ATPase
VPAETAQAQRRQITVMFCDLVDSTALSQTLDPEDLREVMRSYQEAARRVIQRYEGHVAQYLGDGIMVYFGWPRSHGDAAKRAIRSALEVVEAVAQLPAPVKLAVRVGIATGVVVIGHTGDGDASQPRTAVGETPNEAARLLGLAEPNGIVISPLTRQLSGNAFVYEDLGERELKGIKAPVHVWGVAGLGTEESAQQGEHGERTPRLIGREEELGLLRRAWQQCREGRGQVVLLSGEPGIGKSALVAALLAQLRDEGVPCATIRCSPYYTNSAFYPLIEYVKRLVGWQAGDSPEASLERLERTLERAGLPLEEYVTPFASLLSLPLPSGRYPALTLDAHQLKQRIVDSLIDWQFAAAEYQPAVTVWEDLQWADPSTLEYLSVLIDQVPTASLLLVLILRPEFAPPWTVRAHVTPITLNRLERSQIEDLTKVLGKGKAVPEEVLEHIVRKTDGVPLYVEELTKTILSSPVLRETPERYELTGPLSAVAIPATLQESLMARLDRLPSARQVAQLGAVLGREFAYEVLQDLQLIAHSEVDAGLTELVGGELLYQRGRVPRAKYIFKHALIQDAAYQSVLKRTRQQYHRHVAQVLEAHFPNLIETQPELLAYHYSGADMAAEAIAYWVKAAKRAVGSSAYQEALAHADAGMALLSRLAPESRVYPELQLQLLRANALLATRGYFAAETGEAFRLARTLCSQHSEYVNEIFPTLWGLYAYHVTRAEYPLALEAAHDVLQRAQRLGDPAMVVLGHRIVAPSLVLTGQPLAASEHLERVLEDYDPVRDRESASVYGVDFKSAACAWLAHSQFMLGYPDRALALAQESVNHAEKLQHAQSLAQGQYWLAFVHMGRGEPELTLQHARRAMNWSQKYGFPQWHELGKVQAGNALIHLGQVREGIGLIGSAISRSAGMGMRFTRSFNLTMLAVGAARQKEWNEARSRLTEALEEVQATGERWYEAEMHRLRGDFLWREQGVSVASEVESHLHHALEVARDQHAKAWELRAAVSLARVWHSQGHTERARELLAPIYGWFKEGFDTLDVKRAKATLDQLA